MNRTVPRIEGVLPVLKPAGMTSHDVVSAVRRIVRMKRIGHTGTLDPDVTGVLPLCLGRATRIAEWLQDMPKAYEVEMKLGIATDTEDMSGSVIDHVDEVRVTEAQVSEAIRRFIGEIEQTPPMYSAVKVGGRRLYQLARQGQIVERKSRTVTIHHLQVLRTVLDQEQPEIQFSVCCSKGTYIRTLCVDIGHALGYPAVMSSLVRTESGGIHLDQCFSLEQIAELHERSELHQALIPLDQAIQHFPAVFVSEKDGIKAKSGVKLPIASILTEQAERDGDSLLRLYAEGGDFIGVFRINRKMGVVEPIKVFA